MPTTLAISPVLRLRVLILGLHVICFGMLGITTVRGQGLGAGTLQGTIKDPTGGVMQAVEVRLSNPVSGFVRAVTTDTTGRFVFSNLPPNPYHLSVEAQGFQKFERDFDVRAGVPITADLTLTLAGATPSGEGGWPAA